MMKFYNKKHKNKSYRIEDEVMLSLKNIYMRKVSKKLTDKFLRPFKVKKLIGKMAYELKLLLNYERIHSTFHVTLLELY